MPTLDQASRASAATVPMHRGALARSTIISWTLRVATAAALGIDAAIHWQNASAYDAVTATLTQGELFRIEAVLAVAVGLLVLLWPRRGSWVAAVLVGASALGAVLLYRYVDVGTLGPLPDMYENTWQVPGKLQSAYAEGAAVVLAGLGLLAHRGVLPSRFRRVDSAPVALGVITVTEPHDWPLEQPAEGTLRPWYFRATGYLMVLFSDPEEAQRAQRGLLERKVPPEELRLYESKEILRIVARLQEERSILAKAVAALVADPSVKERFLATARTGGAALWLVAATRDRADHLVVLLADYSYSFLRYYGDDGVADVERDP
ncbi:MAG TPA: hypothetical protein VG673_20550, partial [Actinomycetota bacterium]|nr:hypothetical protein [Actinomycetota bacterium]